MLLAKDVGKMVNTVILSKESIEVRRKRCLERSAAGDDDGTGFFAMQWAFCWEMDLENERRSLPRPMGIKEALENKSVHFVGDSVAYGAFKFIMCSLELEANYCNELGGYDSHNKSSEIGYHLGNNVSISFKNALLLSDVIADLQGRGGETEDVSVFVSTGLGNVLSRPDSFKHDVVQFAAGLEDLLEHQQQQQQHLSITLQTAAPLELLSPNLKDDWANAPHRPGFEEQHSGQVRALNDQLALHLAALHPQLRLVDGMWSFRDDASDAKIGNASGARFAWALMWERSV